MAIIDIVNELYTDMRGEFVEYMDFKPLLKVFRKTNDKWLQNRVLSVLNRRIKANSFRDAKYPFYNIMCGFEGNAFTKSRTMYKLMYLNGYISSLKSKSSIITVQDVFNGKYEVEYGDLINNDYTGEAETVYMCITIIKDIKKNRLNRALIRKIIV